MKEYYSGFISFGVPHHQHPLVEELVITELGQNESKNQSNGYSRSESKESKDVTKPS